MFECLVLFSKDRTVGLFMEMEGPFKNQNAGFVIKKLLIGILCLEMPF